MSDGVVSGALDWLVGLVLMVMNLTPILQKLSGGDRRSVGDAYEVAEEVLEAPYLLEEIVYGLQSKDAILRSRTAHVAARVAQAAPGSIQSYKELILNELSLIPQWEVREQMSKVIPLLKLDQNEVTQAFQIFEGYLLDRSSIVRTCAMQGMFDLLAHAPERREAVTKRLGELTRTGSAAMRARGRRLLKRINDT